MPESSQGHQEPGNPTESLVDLNPEIRDSYTPEKKLCYIVLKASIDFLIESGTTKEDLRDFLEEEMTIAMRRKLSGPFV